jgi:hypothetical protein
VDTGKMLRQCQAGPNDVQTGDLLLTVKNAKYSARLFIYLFILPSMVVLKLIWCFLGIVDVGESGGTIVDDVASFMQVRVSSK